MFRIKRQHWPHRSAITHSNNSTPAEEFVQLTGSPAQREAAQHRNDAQKRADLKAEAEAEHAGTNDLAVGYVMLVDGAHEACSDAEAAQDEGCVQHRVVAGEEHESEYL